VHSQSYVEIFEMNSICIILCLFCVAAVHIDPYVKGKRGSSGLIPMPRVGRSDILWPLPG
jgi:hypothetical protein